MQNTVFQEKGMSDATSGVRGLEEKYSNLTRRMQLLEQNVIGYNKRAVTDLKSLNSEIMEVKKQIDDLNEKIGLIAKELQTLAKKEDVDILRKYLDLWEPVNFVTQVGVDRAVQRALEEKTEKK